MDDLRSELAAAAEATGVIPSAPEADTDVTAATSAPVDDVSPVADDAAADDDSLVSAEDLAALDGEEPEPDAPPPDYKAEYERLLAEQQERDERLAQYEAEQRRQQAERSRAEWSQAEARLDGWLWDSMRTINAERVKDEHLIAASEDPAAMRAQLHAVRVGQEQWVRQQYDGQKQIYNQHRFAGYEQAIEQAYVRSFAEKTLKDHRLPADAVDALMFYGDGQPVHPNHYPARAAEMAETRKQLAALRRRATQAQRTDKANELRGKTGAPGGGSSAPSNLDDLPWREQLAWAANAYGIKP